MEITFSLIGHKSWDGLFYFPALYLYLLWLFMFCVLPRKIIPGILVSSNWLLCRTKIGSPKSPILGPRSGRIIVHKVGRIMLHRHMADHQDQSRLRRKTDPYCPPSLLSVNLRQKGLISTRRRWLRLSYKDIIVILMYI